MNESSRDTSLLRKLVAEPTVHFLVLAGLLFLYYGFNGGEQRIIDIQRSEIDARILLLEISSGEASTPALRLAVEDIIIQERVLVAEAKRLGLDNDTRINELLAQKMRHVLSAEVIQPSAAELSNYFQAKQLRYTHPATVSVDELVIRDKQAIVADLHSQFLAGVDINYLTGDIDGSQARLSDIELLDLSAIFDSEFAEQVFAAKFGSWVGPFISNSGQHWLRIIDIKAPALSALEDISDRVRLDWIAEEEEFRLQQQILLLRQQYSVRLSD